MEKKNEIKKPKLTKESISAGLYIFKYIIPYRFHFIFGMILLVLGTVIMMGFVGVGGELVNMAEGKSKFDFGIKLEDAWWPLIIILAVQGVLSYMRTYLFALVSERGMADLRKDLFSKIITQNMQFYEERRVGELTSRITTDVEQLQQVFAITLAEVLRQIVILIIGVVYLFYFMPQLAGIMFLTFPVIVIVAVVFGRYIKKLSKARQDELAETNTIVEEVFQSFSIVKAFANEYFESKRYGKSIDKMVNTSLHFASVRGLFIIFMITILFGAIFFMMWRGALMVQNGDMPAGDLISFVMFTGILGGAIASFSTLYSTILSALGGTEKIREILLSGNEVNIDEAGANTIPKISGDIHFNDVNFAYPARPEIDVLKGIDINIAEGEKVALVGQSGSGKSTIVQLLMKFYNLKSGNISINGKPIEDYNITHLRKNIGIVPQDVIMFGGTIRENILYGNPSANEEQLMHAAAMSNCLEFINNFPEKMETIVGERGIKLSGGQKQRIAIARAILKNPSILVLDEATSSLDAESERVVQEALDNLMQDRTSIIIAHRLSTIKDVDRIYVIDNGIIVEQGTHSELAQSNGMYNSLAKLQFENVN
jgi:ATP-binding cassette, subfamily B, bacterial